MQSRVPLGPGKFHVRSGSSFKCQERKKDEKRTNKQTKQSTIKTKTKQNADMRRGKPQTELKLAFCFINQRMNFNIMPKKRIKKNMSRRKLQTKLKLFLHLSISASPSTQETSYSKILNSFCLIDIYDCGEHGSRSGESTCLPAVWPGFILVPRATRLNL